MRSQLEAFYEALTQSMSQPFSTTVDASKSAYIGASMVLNQTRAHNFSRTRGAESELGQSRRHVERLLLRLDFNGELSKPRKGVRGGVENDILAGLGR